MSTLNAYRQMLSRVQPVGIRGRVSAVRGLTVSVADFPAPVGSECRIGRGGLRGRVIGFIDDHTLVMPVGSTAGICRGDAVRSVAAASTVPVSHAMLGRVLDGLARPIDGGAAIRHELRMPLWPEPIPALGRRRVELAMPTGVRAIDAMLTAGCGQRMGIFSGSGVGKSVLLGMIARNTIADVVVIALVGERGREVRDFVEKDLGRQGLKRAVVIASTGDEPPLVRVQAGATATATAEFFRDRGANVLLLMDSLTRLAAAQRQIGLAAGEPPTTRGYTPSVFAMLPQLLERCGRTESGSITGFYTVLTEGDDANEPVADAVRSVTDGHIMLSRDLAGRGVYPAVDCLASVSRVMVDVADDEHQNAAATLRRVMATYADVADVINVGAYKAGANAEVDRAIRFMPLVRELMTQRIDEQADFAQTRSKLIELAGRVDKTPRGARAPAVTDENK